MSVHLHNTGRSAFGTRWVEVTLSIKVTINGKPAILTELKGELERSVLDAIIDQIKKTIRSTISVKESRQITLHIVGTNIQTLAFGLEGPEIVDKARAGFD
jgi:hypothetical protein